MPTVTIVSFSDLRTASELIAFQEDLLTFHEQHFHKRRDHESIRVAFPTTKSTSLEYQSEPRVWDDDGLGYYTDGIKRTLTDEQIAMFRHSEIQRLVREKQIEAENAGFDEGQRIETSTNSTSQKLSGANEPKPGPEETLSHMDSK
ncbi:MAG: hypothetical protein Q9227_005197 [Pyrenula ochraceoflavens]